MRKFDTKRVPQVRRTRRLRLLAALPVLLPMLLSSTARAGEPFVGVDLGASKPSNAFYRGHVTDGATANPFVGYMLNRFIGAQGQFHFTVQEPKNDFVYPRSNQTTSLFGLTAGPRISVPIDDNFELYATGQGGFFTGLSGALTRTSGGLSAGAGLDYNVSRNFKVGFYGRWNRAYQSPRPSTLVGIQADQQGPSATTWVTAGIGLRYQFAKPAPAPPPPPPANVAEAPPPPPPPPPVKKKIVLRAVHFDFDKSDIRKDAAPILDEAAQILKDEGTVAVVVAGHTDSHGTDEYNQKLSERRADSVKQYLGDHGIPASRVKTVGYGESKPVASNDNADGRQQNRRVELNVD